MTKLGLFSLGFSLLLLGSVDAVPSYPCNHQAGMSPQPKKSARWSGNAEFLFLTATQSELSYAITSSTPEPQPILGDIKYLGYDWRPGVRVAAAYRCCCSEWSLGADFTYVQLSAHGPRTVRPLGGALYATLMEGQQDSSNIAHANQKIDYYLLDIMARRSICVQWAILSPFFGIRLAEIDQHLGYLYFGDEAPVGNQKGSAQLDFKGIGLRGGLGGEACLCKCLSLFGGFGCGALAGQGDNRQIQDPLEPSEITPVRLRLKFDTGKAFFDLKGGLQYQRGCFTARAGYEFQHWVNIAQYVRLISNQNEQAMLPATHGHLTIHGLVLGAAYQF